MAKPLRLRITQQDIENGSRYKPVRGNNNNRSATCPITQALGRRYPTAKEIVTGMCSSRVELKTKTNNFRLAKDAQDFVDACDTHEHVEPCVVTLEPR